MYKTHIQEVQGMSIKLVDSLKAVHRHHFVYFNTYSSRKICLFLAGDYEFLCRLYGLSGASGKSNVLPYQGNTWYIPYIGRHNCLHCIIKSSDLKIPLSERGRSPSRDLQNLAADYNSFSTGGGGHLRNAKHYNNVIQPHFFDIPLENVRD